MGLNNHEKNDDNVHHSLKTSPNQDALKIEIWCNRLYEFFGLPVPKMTLQREALKNPNDEITYIQLTESIIPAENQSIDNLQELAYEYFLLFVLMGDTEIKPENWVVSNNNSIYYFNSGANFIFSSNGDYRKENPKLLTELLTMRDPIANPLLSKWFCHLSKEDLAAQAKKIQKMIGPDLDKILWDFSIDLDLNKELQTNFIQSFNERLNRIICEYLNEITRGYEDKTPIENITAAGVLTYTKVNGQFFVLLAKRDDEACWDNFGGKSDRDDQSLTQTARREVQEESSSIKGDSKKYPLINYSELALEKAPYHDLHTRNKSDFTIEMTYRMYLMQYDYIDPSLFNDGEHSHYYWVPISNIIEAIDNKQFVNYKGSTTIAVEFNGKDIILFPPLFQSLTQVPVYENLLRLSQGHSVQFTQTQSTVDHPSLYSPIPNQPFKFDSLSRPINSRSNRIRELTNTVIHKSQLIREIKNKQEREHRSVNVPDFTTLSKSEFHMKMGLGEAFVETTKNDDENKSMDIISNNIYQYLKHYFKEDFSNLSQENQGHLINSMAQMIRREQEDIHHRFYLYHACDSRIAFLYDFYRKLYELLHQKTAWPVLRSLKVPFDIFNHFSDLVLHYSDNLKKPINNYDKGYQEVALSANVFLFGSTQDESSSSIAYLFKNIGKKYDITKILVKFFEGFEIDEGLIESIVNFMKRWHTNNNTYLYQLGFDLNSIRQLSYASGAMGIVNPHPSTTEINPESLDSLDLISILEKLDPVKDRKYIELLQTRVLVPATTDIRSYRTGLSPNDPLNQEEYHLGLSLLIEQTVHKIYRHFDKMKTQLLFFDKTLSNCIEQQWNRNGLYFKDVLTDNYIVDRIKSGNISMLESIFSKNETLKWKALKLNINPYEKIDPSDEDARKTPMEIILLYAPNKIKMLKELYGDEWFLDNNAMIVIKNHFTNIYELLDNSEKSKLLKNQFDAVLAFLFSQSPPEKSLHWYKNGKLITVDELISLIQASQLVIEYRENTKDYYPFRNNLRCSIAEALSMMTGENTCNTIIIFAHLITKFPGLLPSPFTIPNNNKNPFDKNWFMQPDFHHYIKREFLMIFNLIPFEAYQEFFTYHFDTILEYLLLNSKGLIPSMLRHELCDDKVINLEVLLSCIQKSALDLNKLTTENPSHFAPYLVVSLLEKFATPKHHYSDKTDYRNAIFSALRTRFPNFINKENALLFGVDFATKEMIRNILVDYPKLTLSLFDHLLDEPQLSPLLLEIYPGDKYQVFLTEENFFNYYDAIFEITETNEDRLDLFVKAGKDLLTHSPTLITTFVDKLLHQYPLPTRLSLSLYGELMTIFPDDMMKLFRHELFEQGFNPESDSVNEISYLTFASDKLKCKG